jgi:anaerobic selenocysteine-containing dehydrogenase
VPLKSSQVDAFARAVAARVGVAGASGTAPAGTEALGRGDCRRPARTVAARSCRRRRAAASVHALAHAMNEALGNGGQTVPTCRRPKPVPSEQLADASRAGRSDMDAGRVQMLLMIGESNPVFSAPADLNFADALARCPRVHSGLFLDETAELCHWHVPATHYLEAWSDARTIDGTASIVQPLIQPMYGGKSAHEVMATLTDLPDRATATTSCASSGRRSRRAAGRAGAARGVREGLARAGCTTA